MALQAHISIGRTDMQFQRDTDANCQDDVNAALRGAGRKIRAILDSEFGKLSAH